MDLDKRNFVNKYLSKVVEEICENVSYCEYIQDTDKREYVLIVYRNGYVARVCVSAASNLCIMRDVSNYLLYH